MGKQLLHTGAQVASDVLSGQNVGQSIKARGKLAAGKALDKFLDRQTPRKRKRPSTTTRAKKRRKTSNTIFA